MDFPEADNSHLKQKKFTSGCNFESKPKISLNVRKRLFFTTCQVNELKQILERNWNEIPSIHIRKELAKKMGVSQIKIRKWFYHKIRYHAFESNYCKNKSKSLLNRRKFKLHELIELERVFEKNHYPDDNIRTDLAQRMGVSELKINTWFTKRRYKLLKHVSSLTCTEGGYDNFITSSTDVVNYPPAPFYTPANTMPPDYSHRYPQFQSQPDFSTAFSAEQYSSHYVPLTHQWTDFDTQSFSTIGSPTYSFPATVTYPHWC